MSIERIGLLLPESTEYSINQELFAPIESYSGVAKSGPIAG